MKLCGRCNGGGRDPAEPTDRCFRCWGARYVYVDSPYTGVVGGKYQPKRPDIYETHGLLSDGKLRGGAT